MKTRACIALMHLAMTVAVGQVAVSQADEPADPMARYKPVIERAPFGVVQGTGKLDVPQPLQKYIFAGVVTDPLTGRDLAIIYDKEHLRSYLRAEGEAFEGVKVVKIERAPATEKGAPAQPKVTLQKDFDVATLEYVARPAGAAGVMPAGASPMPNPGMMPGATPNMVTPATPGSPVPVPRRIPFRRGDDK